MHQGQDIKKEIEDWCSRNGVIITSGFYRHPAQRYAAIDLSHEPPKLVARTWFNLEDMQYYSDNVGQAASYRFLDFKERHELKLSESGRLVRSHGL